MKNEKQQLKNKKLIGLKFLTFLVACCLLLVASTHAVTKPLPSADLNFFSYVFYLYYDNGQLFGDRDHEVKYDIINEAFVPQVIAPGGYRFEILNSKSEVVQTTQFDPRQGSPDFIVGKIQVKGSYVPNGQRVIFYNDQNKQLISLFIFEGALCNDDGSCSLGQGENEKTCPSDCIKKTTTPLPAATPVPLDDDSFDVMGIITYVVGGLAVVVIAWFGWKWWKGKREENFLPPPPPASPLSGPSILSQPPSQGPTPTPPPLSGGNLPPIR